MGRHIGIERSAARRSAGSRFLLRAYCAGLHRKLGRMGASRHMVPIGCTADVGGRQAIGRLMAGCRPPA